MGETIKRTRGGKAPELKQILENWTRAKGTEPTYTLTNSSSQNGTAERTIRTVNDGVRTMLSETDLGERFWGEAARATVYISNRTLGTQGVPHLYSFGVEPRTDHIRRWEFRATRHTAASRHGPRGSESLLLRHDENVDGRYILLDVYARKVGVTESVHFYENVQANNQKEEKGLPQAEDYDVSKGPWSLGREVLEKKESADSDQANSEVEMAEGRGEDQGGEEDGLRITKNCNSAIMQRWTVTLLVAFAASALAAPPSNVQNVGENKRLDGDVGVARRDIICSSAGDVYICVDEDNVAFEVPIEWC
ncbi:Retrovirus-related Pol polyprotein from transposon TNT 1-94 [Ceratocystis lukuohia]|uniref:Retrovirus-related Pol polyprotein from transposon TNT 1-94 n=1 Tax=Ceratocystis lukuohia TaxID=2019550 RepID=A0ABR4MGW3_9PEZI